MALLRPFRAVRYADSSVLPAATCPPYDVLSPAERQALIERSPVATARLILPEGEGDARYAHAADLWQTWRSAGVMVNDSAPALYVTRTEFTRPDTGEQQTRLGLVGALRLHRYEDRVVLPHEHTLSKPKADRLSLLRATHANFESIMLLADDTDQSLYHLMDAATGGAPVAAFVGDDDQGHTLWAVTDEAAVGALAARLAPHPVYIADGHHRYETSVAYAEETGALGREQPEAFLLATLLSSADPGVALLPTHRLVKDVPADLLGNVQSNLGELFDVRETSLEEMEARLRTPSATNQPVLGLMLRSGLYELTSRDWPTTEAALPAGIAPSLRGLDVTLAQHLILDRALGLPASETATTDRLAYTRDTKEAVARVQAGEFDAAVLLGHTPAKAVFDVSDANEVMPQKSTFFYPKLLSGLVLRALEE